MPNLSRKTEALKLKFDILCPGTADQRHRFRIEQAVEIKTHGLLTLGAQGAKEITADNMPLNF